jgi:hypothetical protein
LSCGNESRGFDLGLPFFGGFRYGGCVRDGKERGGSGVNGRDEAGAGGEVDCASCHGRSVGYIWSHHRRDYQHREDEKGGVEGTKTGTLREKLRE